MNLPEQIESLGAHVEAGDLEYEDAVQALVEWADGALTHAGARGWLQDWRDARAFLDALIASIPPAIEALEAAELSTTPEERVGATAAADQAMARFRDAGEPDLDGDVPGIR